MLEIGGVDPVAEQERSHTSPFRRLRLIVHGRRLGRPLVALTWVTETLWARSGGSDELAVRQAEKNQAAQNHGDKAKGALLAGPGARLPHGKIFAANHNESEKPQAESDPATANDLARLKLFAGAHNRSNNAAAPS